MEKVPKEVFVALSGGVDSSVVAALLVEAGYDVTGVFIKGWYPAWLPCDWRRERQDAMRVAARLDIPFETFDFGEEYRREVAEYMVAEYARGRTPNPDVMCNKHIKFGAFLKESLHRGADMIATGHYARLRRTGTSIELLVGVDGNKDQSYFLWTLGQEVLKKTLFPVGEYTKPEVRELARKFKLPTAEKKDSQGICFLGDVDVRDFLKRQVKTAPGDVLDEQGSVIGVHEGALLYTLGQRHGFTVFARRPDEERHYIVAKDIERNAITVSEEPRAPVFTVSEVTLDDVNWIANPPREAVSYGARFRYRQPLQPCRLEKQDMWNVMFDEPQAAVAPGQSLVLYDADVCLGGGIT